MADFTPSHTLNMEDEGFRALGVTFSRADQALILDRFVNRYTGDHTPAWAQVPDQGGIPWPLQFASDQDWLEHTSFAISMAGKLDQRIKRCWEKPTWPGDPMAYGKLIKDLPFFVQVRFGKNLQHKNWNSAFNKFVRAWTEEQRMNEEKRRRDIAAIIEALPESDDDAGK